MYLDVSSASFSFLFFFLLLFFSKTKFPCSPGWPWTPWMNLNPDCPVKWIRGLQTYTTVSIFILIFLRNYLLNDRYCILKVVRTVDGTFLNKDYSLLRKSVEGSHRHPLKPALRASWAGAFGCMPSVLSRSHFPSRPWNLHFPFYPLSGGRNYF